MNRGWPQTARVPKVRCGRIMAPNGAFSTQLHLCPGVLNTLRTGKRL